MRYHRTTQVPNELFDEYLVSLTPSELKVLLIILRQTYGWKSMNGNRKQRDRITYGQFIEKTGISRRVISETVQSLIIKQLIRVTNYQGHQLHSPKNRKGKVGIYYAPLFPTNAEKYNRVCRNAHQRMQKGVYNKTKETKLKGQNECTRKPARKSDYQRLEEIFIDRQNHHERTPTSQPQDRV